MGGIWRVSMRIAVGALLVAVSATAAASDITEFSLPEFSQAGRIVAGPDGNLWFVEAGPNTGGGIARITPAGAITQFPLTTGRFAGPGIVVGPDHNLWFAETGGGGAGGAIARMTTSGTLTEFPLPAIEGNVVQPGDLANGSDGAVWFTAAVQSYDFNTFQYDCRQTIGRITLAGAITLTSYFGPTLNGGVCASSLAKGADGNLWFAVDENSSIANDIARITTAGTATSFPLPNDSTAGEIVSGADGNLWFTQNVPAIGRISLAGDVANFSLPSDAQRRPEHIAPGPDGNLWFSEKGNYTPALGKIAPDGTITEFPLAGAYPSALELGGITAGPDGKLWFTDTTNDKIGTFATTLSVPIEPSFTGAWFDPTQSGHGLFVEVLPDNRFLAWWFTFAPDGGQAWFGGVGTYSGNTATITEVALTTGGRFIPNFDPSTITKTLWGSLTFTFDDCNHGRVDFASVLGYGSGSMPLTRLTQIDGTTCPRSGIP
ncbi:MAG TPA: hypothetical protein VFB32_01070, partial [Rudaea sp.]|nr:hypothetical protein [Rudaea sp.]